MCACLLPLSLSQGIFGIEDINDVRNGLLLFRPVERAFDEWRLCLIPQLGAGLTQQVAIHMLDPDLADKEVVSTLPEVRGCLMLFA